MGSTPVHPQDVRPDQDPLVAKGCLKEGGRCGPPEQGFSFTEGLGEVIVMTDQNASGHKPAGHLAHAVADVKDMLLTGGYLKEVRPMDLQPEASGALEPGKDPGLGEAVLTHRPMIINVKEMWISC